MLSERAGEGLGIRALVEANFVGKARGAPTACEENDRAALFGQDENCSMIGKMQHGRFHQLAPIGRR